MWEKVRRQRNKRTLKRLIILSALFLGIGSLTYWLLNRAPEQSYSSFGEDRLFAFEDTARIHKIFLARREGDPVTLKRKDGYWVYNDQYRARPNAMANLLDAVARIQMKYQPAEAAVEHMVRSLATRGIKVELYDRSGQLVKAYYVGGASADERGAYVIMEGSDQPYVAHLAGWEGNLRYRFNLQGEDWRDKAVFRAAPSRIAAVSVEYPKQRNKSFRLKREDGHYRVEPYYELTPAIERPRREGGAEAFLLGFEELGAEAFENDNPRRDSITELTPFSIIRLEKTDGEQKTVKLYPIYPRDAAGNIVQRPRVAGPAIERYFAESSTGDFYLVQHRVFEKVLWAYDFFFEEYNH